MLARAMPLHTELIQFNKILIDIPRFRITNTIKNESPVVYETAPPLFTFRIPITDQNEL